MYARARARGGGGRCVWYVYALYVLGEFSKNSVRVIIGVCMFEHTPIQLALTWLCNLQCEQPMVTNGLD